MIRSYVEDDPSAFYTVSEFDTAYKTLKSFCILRAQSIRKQLSGEIPSTTEGQSVEVVTLVNADDININDMGSQGSGKNDKGFPGGPNAEEGENKQLPDTAVKSNKSRKNNNAKQ